VYVSVIVRDLETSLGGVLGPSGAVTPQKTAHGTLVVAFFWYAGRTLDILSYFSVYSTLVISVCLVAVHWN
jgi:hypothetical protein